MDIENLYHELVKIRLLLDIDLVKAKQLLTNLNKTIFNKIKGEI